ncbi:hypothetical protein AGOR_G00079570 [Albula goreensis]|uniref:Ig-like domain-containing protein n=1 Tax=Albula goreensis TaxID=1534307 RepID=A0A8T3DIJ8_9TELE|nr:hypothetical protein AGOR_G00079570 [Albula goreensis]
MSARCYLHRLSAYLFVILSVRSSESLSSINAECGANVSLPCDATNQANLAYRSVVWYKLDGNKNGVVRKNQNGETVSYAGARTAMIGDSEELVLPDIRPEDSGFYLCHLSAKVGHSNKESKLLLNVSECVTQATPTSDSDWHVTDATAMPSSHEPCMGETTQVIQISTAQILSGFSAVAVVKGLLCVLTIWVLLAATRKEERRRMSFWS